MTKTVYSGPKDQSNTSTTSILMPIPLAMSRTEVLSPVGIPVVTPRDRSGYPAIPSTAGTSPWLGTAMLVTIREEASIHWASGGVAIFIRWFAGIHPGQRSKISMQEACISIQYNSRYNPDVCDKPLPGVKADGVHSDMIHSATIVLAELGANVVQSHHLLGELKVVTQIIGVAQVAENVDDLLLLAHELLGELVTLLLALLLRCDLDNLVSLLTSLLGRSLALTADGLALGLTGHGGRRRLSSGAIVLMNTLHMIKEVVAAGETVTWYSTLAVAEVAQVRPGTMTMHSVSLTLVAQKTGS
jgi:hypothetical protein